MKNMQTPSASGSASKRLKRLNDLRQKVPHCSKAALEAILRDIADKGLPEAKSAKNMRAAADEALSDCNRFGDLLLPQEVTMKDGTAQAITIVNLLSFVYKAYQCGGQFYAVLNEVWQKHGPTSPSNKFNLALYSDECFPGNPLSGKAVKKKIVGSVRYLEGAWL